MVVGNAIWCKKAKGEEGGETKVQSTLDMIIKSSLHFSKGGESN